MMLSLLTVGVFELVYIFCVIRIHMSVIGVILKTIKERVPFATNIAVLVFGGLWSVANVFAEL